MQLPDMTGYYPIVKIETSRFRRRGVWGAAGIALLAVAGCVGPALVAAGIFGTLGAALHSPWLDLAAVITLVGAITVVMVRRGNR